LIEVANRGTQPVNRELVLRDASGDHEVAAFELEPGETRQITTQSSAGHWLAELQPSDSLALDDSLLLDQSAFEPVITTVDAECTAPLQRALAAHPGLAISTDDVSELYVNCSDRALYPPRGLRFYAGNSLPVIASPMWLPGADRFDDINLRQDWLLASPWPSGAPADANVMLVAGDDALIVSRNDGALIESVIDMNAPTLARQPEFAALIAGLVDAALGREVLDPVAAVARGLDDSTIAPVSIAGTATLNAVTSAERAGISNVFILLALLVLGVDVVLIATTRRRARREQD